MPVYIIRDPEEAISLEPRVENSKNIGFLHIYKEFGSRN